MKKFYYFLLLVLALTVFSCTIPKEIEVRGSISNIKFEAASMDFGKEIMNMIEGSFGDGDSYKMQDCVDIHDIQTYLVYMTAIDRDFEFAAEGGNKLTIDNKPYDLFDNYLLEDAIVYNSADPNREESITLSFSTFKDSLKGFSFCSGDLKAVLYIDSGNPIVESAAVEIKFIELDENGEEINPDSPLSQKIPEAGNIVKRLSGIDSDASSYTGTEAPWKKEPLYGYEINYFAAMLNDKKDYKIKIEVVLPAGTYIPDDLLDGATVDIKAELLVWLPMDMVANEGGAEILFPDIFSGVGSVINSISRFMERLTIIVEMKPVNPFSEGELVMTQKDTPLDIRNKLNEKELLFDIKESDMEIIGNLDIDFKPDFGIVYSEGKELKIPKEFGMASISLNAEISYMIMGDK